MRPRPLPGLPGEQGGSVDDSSRLRAGLAQGPEDGHSGPHTWGGVFLLQLHWSPLRPAPAPPPPPGLPGEQRGSVDDSLRVRTELAQGLEDGHSAPHTWGGVFPLQPPWSPPRPAPAPPSLTDSLPAGSLGSKWGQRMIAHVCEQDYLMISSK